MHTQYTEQGTHRYKKWKNIVVTFDLPPSRSINPYIPNKIWAERYKIRNQMKKRCALKAHTHTPYSMGWLLCLMHSIAMCVSVFWWMLCEKPVFESVGYALYTVISLATSVFWIPYSGIYVVHELWLLHQYMHKHTHKHTHATAKTIILFKYTYTYFCECLLNRMYYIGCYFFVAIAGSGSQTDHIPNQPKYTQQRRIELQQFFFVQTIFSFILFNIDDCLCLSDV